jgi:hypothetical protein
MELLREIDQAIGFFSAVGHCGLAGAAHCDSEVVACEFRGAERWASTVLLRLQCAREEAVHAGKRDTRKDRT